MNGKRLRQDLAGLGVKPGDLIMIHASLRKIGLVRTEHGEPDRAYRALLSQLG